MNDSVEYTEIDKEEYKDYKFWYVNTVNTLWERGWEKHKNFWLSPKKELMVHDLKIALRYSDILHNKGWVEIVPRTPFEVIEGIDDVALKKEKDWE